VLARHLQVSSSSSPPSSAAAAQSATSSSPTRDGQKAPPTTPPTQQRARPASNSDLVTPTGSKPLAADARGFVISPDGEPFAGPLHLRFGQSPVLIGRPSAPLLFAQGTSWPVAKAWIARFAGEAAALAHARARVPDDACGDRDQRTALIAVATAMLVARAGTLAGKYVSRSAILQYAAAFDDTLDSVAEARIVHIARTALIITRVCDHAGFLTAINVASSSVQFRKHVTDLKTQLSNNVSQSQIGVVQSGAARSGSGTVVVNGTSG
jgi:hypothetical protein